MDTQIQEVVREALKAGKDLGETSRAADQLRSQKQQEQQLQKVLQETKERMEQKTLEMKGKFDKMCDQLQAQGSEFKSSVKDFEVVSKTVLRLRLFLNISSLCITCVIYVLQSDTPSLGGHG